MGRLSLEYLFLCIILALLCTPGTARAQCSSPAGTAGQIGYNLTGSGGVEYCNGTNWVTAGTITDEMPNTALSASLIGHWRLNETSGTSVADASGNGNTGTMAGNLTGADSIAGIVGTGLNLDGTNTTQISLNAPANMNQFTACTWVNFNSLTNTDADPEIYIFSYMWRIHLNNSTNKLEFWIPTSSSYPRAYSNTTITTGTWYHVCGVFYGVGTNPDIYINGAPDNDGNEDFGSGSLGDNSGRTLTAGASDINDYYGNINGALDDIRIYNRALSASEIAYLYSSTNKLVAHWSLDETSGASIADSSGNGHSGTWTDGANDLVTEETMPGRVGNALLFDNWDNMINFGSDASLDNLTPLTVCYWLYAYSLPGGYDSVVTKVPNAGTEADKGWDMYIGYDESFGMSTWNGGYNEQQYTPLTNTWQHFCATWDGSAGGGGIVSYLNGSLLRASGSNWTTSTMDDSPYNITVGRRYDNEGAIDGLIDDVRIYNRVLSATDVSRIYNADTITTTSSNLLGYWKMNDTAGSTVADSLGYGQTGTFNGNAAVVSTTGKIGTALSLDGSNDYIDFGNLSLIDGASEASICLWMKYTAADVSADGAILNEYPYSGWMLFVDNVGWFSGRTNTLSFSVDTAQLEGSTDLVVPGQWAHYCATFKGGTAMRLYKNGILDRSITSSIPATVPSNLDALYLGMTQDSARLLQADVDEVRIYNRELTSGEVSRLSICTKPGEMGYNFSTHVLQWCGPSLEVYNVGTPGAGGAGCAAAGAIAAGAEGTLQFDTGSNKMVFCDGANWVAIPN